MNLKKVTVVLRSGPDIVNAFEITSPRLYIYQGSKFRVQLKNT